MVDRDSDRQGSESEEGGSNSNNNNNSIRLCVDCGTSKTPLWRTGPAGPKTLCNACGIKSRKKRGTVLSVLKEEKKAKKSSINSTHINRTTGYSVNNSQNSRSRDSSNDFKLSPSMKDKLVPLGKEVVFQSSVAERLRRRIGEEEQAAMLLIALSCGSVHC